MKIFAASKGFLFALGLLLCLEFGVRFMLEDNVSGRFEYGYHPTAGFVEDGEQLNLVRAGGRRFRPQSLSINKDPGKLRFFTAGGSVPRGPSLEGAYVFQFQEILKENGIATESYNLACGGFGARRKSIVIKAALKYDPDYAIIHLNDSNEFEDEREFNRSQEFKKFHPKNLAMRSFIIRRIYEMKTEKVFWKWLPEEIRNTRAITDADAELSDSLNKDKLYQWHKLVAEVLREDIHAVREAGAKVIIVVQCNLDIQADGNSKLIRNDFLEDLARSEKSSDVSVISMYDCLIDSDAKKHFSDGAHMRRSGHEILARSIAQNVTNLRSKDK